MIIVLALAGTAIAEPGPATCPAHELRSTRVRTFDAPGADPWPGLTPSGDSAAWARVAGALRQDRLPPPGAAQVEELVAALPSDDPPPAPGDDLVVRAETARSTWDPEVAVVRIAVTTRRPRPLDRDPIHIALVVDAGLEADTGFDAVRIAARELASAMRDDDMLTILDSARGVVLPQIPLADRARVERAIDQLTPTTGDDDLPGELARAYQGFGAGSGRVVLLSDGGVELIEQGDALAALVASRAAVGVGFAAVGHGVLHGRDEGLESLARASGGTYLHLEGPADTRRVLGDRLSMLVEPVVTDVRLLVEWGPSVTGVHRTGNHFDRLDGLGPTEPAGRELGAGRTAVVVFEVRTSSSTESLGTVKVRSTPVGTGVPQIDEIALPAVTRSLDAASRSLRLAVAASTLGELLAGTQPLDRTYGLVALAEGAKRPEYEEDAELVELVRAAVPLLRTPGCRWW